MPFFEYLAINNNQQKVKAIIEAASEEEAFQAVSERGLILVKMAEIKDGKSGGGFVFFNRIKAKDLVIFSRQFAVMLKATVPVVKALRILIKQTSNVNLQKIVTEVADEVEGGMKLSLALSKHPKVFGDFFVAMVKSGETSGQLDEILEYLANQQEKDYDLISKIRGAMTYPIFIVGMLIAVGVIMMIFVVPKLTSILAETGGEFPLTTKILIATSNFLVNFWWVLLIILLGLVWGIRTGVKTENGRRYWDVFLLKIPIFGKLFQKIYLVRFARSLSTLTSGGIPLVDALKITSEVVGNKVYQDIITKTIAEVEEGNTIASVLSNEKAMPPMISYMVSVGEQTGKLDIVLDKLASFYNREIDNLVTNLVSLIEPLIMVGLGLAVGVMVSAVLMPMYNLASSI
ncbi:MAG TPA: type II secretion system F family protein [bacterium]|nr:type II secretion system F family protein [bacterium]HPL95683.1 type II secretion system F family protein [bacterium]